MSEKFETTNFDALRSRADRKIASAAFALAILGASLLAVLAIILWLVL